MKKSLLYVVIAVLMMSISIPVYAQDDPPSCSGVLLFEGRARASVTNTAAAYGLLVNLGDEPVTLTGGSTDAAEVVEVHTMTVDENDVMHMEPLPDGLTIPPHSYVTLAPGGLHMMLINLSAPLEAGNMLDFTFDFDGAESMTATLPILDMQNDMGGDMSGMSNDSDMSGMSHDSGMSGSSMPGMAGIAEGCHGVFVVDPWIRQSVTATGAGYGLIINLTDGDITLTGATTDAAEVVEVHSMSVDDNDVMHMDPLPDGVTLHPGQHALLQPGGMHLMLINLTDMLMAGSTVDLTLTFEGTDPIELTVPVIDPDAATDDMDMGGMESMSSDG